MRISKSLRISNLIIYTYITTEKNNLYSLSSLVRDVLFLSELFFVFPNYNYIMIYVC